jgi:hypothetical protein
MALRMAAGRDYVSEKTVMRLAGGGIAIVAALAFVNVALTA